MPLLHLILTSCASACGRLTFDSSRCRRRLHRRRISGIKLRRQTDGIWLPPTARQAIHGSKAVLTAGENRPTTATLSWRLCTKFDPWTLGATLCRQDVALCTVRIIITTEYPNFAVVRVRAAAAARVRCCSEPPGLWRHASGLIKEDNGVRSQADFGCDLVEMELHGFAVASRQHEGGAGSTFGTDPTKQISRSGPLIVGGTGA